jgi:hypothetical protein
MPLGTGVKTDIRTGAPILDNPRVRKEELEARLQEVVSRSRAFQADLNGPGAGAGCHGGTDDRLCRRNSPQDQAYKNFWQLCNG